jgi:PAS domain S-box-containing protein
LAGLQEQLQAPSEQAAAAVQEASRELSRLLDDLQPARSELRGEGPSGPTRDQSFFSLLNLIPGYCCVLTPDYRFRFVNQRFLDLFGDPGDQPCYKFLFGRRTRCKDCKTFACLATGMPVTWEWLSPHSSIYEVHDYPFLDTDGSELILEFGIDVTDRKLTQAELEHERMLLQAILDQIPVGILVAEAESGNIILVNDEVREIWRQPEASPHTLQDFSRLPQYRPGARRPVKLPHLPLYRALMHGEIVVEEDWEIQRDDGTRGIIRADAIPIRDTSGKIVAAVVALIDVTERRSQEEELRRHREQLQELVEERTQQLQLTAEQLRVQHAFTTAVLDTAASLVVVFNRRGHIVTFNRACEKLTGYTLAELQDRPFWDILLVPEEAEEVKRVFGELLCNLPNQHANYWVTRSGKRRLINWNNSVLLDERDEVEYVVAVGLDVTEHRALENALEASEAKYRSLVESANVIMLSTDTEGRLTFVNPFAARFFGWTEEELLGQPAVGTIFPPADTEGQDLASLIAAVVAHPEQHPHSECEGLTRDGQRKWLAWSNRPLRNDRGDLQGLLAIGTDRTEQREAEKVLHAAYAYNRGLIEASLDPLVTISADGTVTDVNRATERVTGRSREELIGTDFSDYFTDPDAARGGYEEAFREGQVTDYPLEIVSADGHATSVLYNATVYRNEQGEILGVFASARDITERVQADQDRALYQENLRTLATELALAEERERRRIATGLHDHISQTLALSKLKLGLLGQACEQSAGPLVSEVSGLLDQVIGYTRTLTFELSPPILSELGLEAALEWLASQTDDRYGFTCALEDDGADKPLAEDMRGLLYESVRELLANVAKHAQARHATLRLAREGGLVRLEVEDDGRGFDPARATDSAVHSESFGLFNIRERLEFQGGSIEIDSTLGQGTRITLRAPLSLT